ncbi:hypothetical protein ACN2LU_002124 [Vibrio vulnificus]
MVKNEDTLGLILSSMGSFKVHISDIDISMICDLPISNKSWETICKNSGYFYCYRAPIEEDSDMVRPLMFIPNTWGGVKKSIRIKFCAHCIKESIIENGFGYHKAIWLKNELVCQAHSQPLKVIVSNTKATTRELLRKVLSGFTLPYEATPYIESLRRESVLDPRLEGMDCIKV